MRFKYTTFTLVFFIFLMWTFHITLYNRKAKALKKSDTFHVFSREYELKYGKSLPKGYDKWFDYAIKQQCLLNDYESIYTDLAPFRGLNKSELYSRLHLLQDSPGIMSIDIVNGRIYPTEYRSFVLIRDIVSWLPDMQIHVNALDEPRVFWNSKNQKSLKNLYKSISDVDWFSPVLSTYYQDFKEECNVIYKDKPWKSMNEYHGFTLSPHTAVFTTNLMPIFSSSRFEPCFADIRMPSAFYFRGFERNDYLEFHADSFAWEHKIPRAYWRGSTTGGELNLTHHAYSHRTRFVSKTQEHPLFDVAFTQIVQCVGVGCKAKIKKDYRFDKHRDFNYMTRFKYLIDIDGNTNSRRFLELIKTNSLVFKVTLASEFYQGWLIPFVHYIPISMDFSDLEEKVKWAIKNDDLAKQIARNGRDFVLHHMRDQDLNCFTFRLLLEYADLFL